MSDFSGELYAPPARAGRILAVFLPHDRRDEMLADLVEEFQLLAKTEGLRAAKRWYAAQICRSIAPVLGHWIEMRATSPVTMRIPSTGAIFFAFAVAWFAAVACTAPLHAQRDPAAESPGAAQAGAVTLQDGSARAVYWLSETTPIERFGTLALMRFSIVALAPPAAAALAILLGLSVFSFGAEQSSKAKSPRPGGGRGFSGAGENQRRARVL